MSTITPQDYSLRHGKMSKDSAIVYRTRNGKQQSYIPKPNTLPPSKAQNTHRKFFGKVNTIVNAIMADPKQQAEWNERRLAYNKSIALDMKAKRYKTTRSYCFHVVSTQLASTPNARRRATAIPHALPKGLKLHIKPFAELSTTELYEMLKARFSVFYTEQHCAYLDMDDIDYRAFHLALFRQGHVVAYARLFPSDQPGQWLVGRMLTTERGCGFGRYIMEQTIAEAQRQGASSLHLHAQSHAVGFYQRLGFTTYGLPFTEAEIPHIAMQLSLKSGD